MRTLLLCMTCLVAARASSPLVMPSVPLIRPHGPVQPPEPESSDKPSSLEIRKLHMRSDIAFRFATTHVTSQLANAGNEASEATFRVTLPKTAFMSNFSMVINGETIYGEVKEKEKAKEEYEAAKSLGQSAGHVAATTRDSNKFAVSVNVAAGEKVTFDLTYQEVLQRRRGHYEHVINIDPGQVVPDLLVEVSINESRPLTDLAVPPLKKDIENEIFGAEQNPDAVVTTTGENSALVVYKPSVEAQRKASDKGLAGQFMVQYDVQRGLDGGELQVVNGYFVHTVAPEGLPPVPKNILFILDVSGSMWGRKMEQVKEAMNAIVDDLRHEDTFNLLTFDDKFTWWRKELNKVDADSVRAAKEFVKGMEPNGMTDIHGALSQGINFLSSQGASDQQRPSIIIFLTDGDPTAGVTNPDTIRQRIRAANEGRYAIFSLGFGDGVDFNFLKKLSLQNGGLARKIYEASDAALQLRHFYREVSIPLLSDVTIRYETQGATPTEMTKHTFKTYFSGGEMLVTGRLTDYKSGPQGCVIRPCILGKPASGMPITICPPGPWPPVFPPRPPPTPAWTPETGLAAYIERMWAYLTIRELLDRELSATNTTEKESLKQRALELSLRFRFVTPLTSMVVTLPNKTDDNLGSLRDSADEGSDNIGYSYPASYPARRRAMPYGAMPPARGQGSVPRMSVARSYGPQGMPGIQYGPMGMPSMQYDPQGMPGRPGPLGVFARTQGPSTSSTTPEPTTTAAPVVGEPSMSVRIRTGVVCLAWPQMALSAHTLLKAPGIELKVTHGPAAKVQSISVTTAGGTAIISPSSLLLGSQLRLWGQSYNGTNVTVSGNKVELQPLPGVKVTVHRTSASTLFLEVHDISGATRPVFGLLRNARSWQLHPSGTLRMPSRGGVVELRTRSVSSADGLPACRATLDDVFVVARHSRRA